ncbi:MAG: hypothetical protein ACRCST_10040 [Turicibacter sp.]
MNEQNEVEVFNCESCGGAMTFDVKTQALKCPYCESERVIEDARPVKEYDFSEVSSMEEKSSWNDEVEVIECESCGGQTVVERHQTAAFCSYCGSSHILKSKQNAGIKPEGILPFKIDQHQAHDVMEKWFKQRWLAPNNLKVLYQSEKLQGIYVPYWTYDAQTHGVYNGQGGRYYRVTQEVNDKKQTVTKVRWYNVHGSVSHFFDDVLVNGSEHFNNSVMAGVEPFNTIDRLELYKPEYLAGYQAERYSHGVKECFNVAKGKMQQQLEEDARAEVLMHYDTARGITVRSHFNHVKFKHVLLPVYSAQYDYKGKKYKFVINGETGRIDGTYPYSWVKIMLVVMFGILVVMRFMGYMNS